MNKQIAIGMTLVVLLGLVVSSEAYQPLMQRLHATVSNAANDISSMKAEIRVTKDAINESARKYSNFKLCHLKEMQMVCEMPNPHKILINRYHALIHELELKETGKNSKELPEQLELITTFSDIDQIHNTLQKREKIKAEIDTYQQMIIDYQTKIESSSSSINLCELINIAYPCDDLIRRSLLETQSNHILTLQRLNKDLQGSDSEFH